MSLRVTVYPNLRGEGDTLKIIGLLVSERVNISLSYKRLFFFNILGISGSGAKL